MSRFSSKRNQSRSHWLRLLIILGVAWAIVGSVTYYRTRATFLDAPARLDTTRSRLRIARYTGFFPLKGRLNEMDNIIDILSGKEPRHMRPDQLGPSEYSQVLDNVLNQAQVDTFGRLMDYLNRRGIHLDRYEGLYLFDQGKFEDAAKLLKNSPSFADVFKSGKIPVVQDVLDYDIHNRSFTAKLPGTSFLETHFDRNRHFLRLYNSSLDSEVQRVLYQSLGKWNGAFLVSENGHLLAMCGKGMDPLTDTFEAGSVIKIVTMAASLYQNVSVSFPYMCTKPIRVGGKIFYDWKSHGRLNNLEEGFACSCNLVFAETALRLGPEVINHWFDQFGINENDKVDFQEFSAKLGVKHGDIGNDYQLARAAIGLDVPYVTPYWLVRTAATINGDGYIVSPTPLLSESIVGNPSVDIHITPHIGDALLDSTSLDAIRNAMRKAVTWKEGTGHRADIPDFNLRLKTGTAGKSPYNSVLLGTFDILGKHYSFGLFLKKGGRAEFNGTAVLKQALRRLQTVMAMRQRPEARQ